MLGVTFKKSIFSQALCCIAFFFATSGASPLQAQTVIFETNMGNVEVELFGDTQPFTVANFLQYVNSDAYDNTIFHRSIPGFVIQGGGFGPTGAPVSTLAPVQNEPGISNTRGTIAMAKLSGQPDSATSQWFFNVVDNTALDTQNAGFTVFGEVTSGMATVDSINSLPTFDLGGAFTDLPGIPNGPDHSFVTLSDIRIVAVPEPNTLALLILSGSICTLPRRRRA